MILKSLRSGLLKPVSRLDLILVEGYRDYHSLRNKETDHVGIAASPPSNIFPSAPPSPLSVSSSPTGTYTSESPSELLKRLLTTQSLNPDGREQYDGISPSCRSTVQVVRHCLERVATEALSEQIKVVRIVSSINPPDSLCIRLTQELLDCLLEGLEDETHQRNLVAEGGGYLLSQLASAVARCRLTSSRSSMDGLVRSAVWLVDGLRRLIAATEAGPPQSRSTDERLICRIISNIGTTCSAFNDMRIT